jgi:hypothetical protein
MRCIAPEGERLDRRLAERKICGGEVLMKFSTITILAIVVGVVAFEGSTAAQIPVAIVEDVRGKATSVEFMDYVASGDVIKLGPAATLVLSYMKSCRRETITGAGTVTVGAEESIVQDGQVVASKVKCDSGYSRLIDQQLESAATSFRSLDVSGSPSTPLTLYGLSPFFETTGRGKLVVERLDMKGERHEINLATAPLLRRKFYDFAKTGTSLKPGGTYAASLGGQRAVFVIDSRAEPGPTPIIGRLVRLQQ